MQVRKLAQNLNMITFEKLNVFNLIIFSLQIYNDNNFYIYGDTRTKLTI